VLICFPVGFYLFFQNVNDISWPNLNKSWLKSKHHGHFFVRALFTVKNESKSLFEIWLIDMKVLDSSGKIIGRCLLISIISVIYQLKQLFTHFWRCRNNYKRLVLLDLKRNFYHLFKLLLSFKYDFKHAFDHPFHVFFYRVVFLCSILKRKFYRFPIFRVLAALCA